MSQAGSSASPEPSPPPGPPPGPTLSVDPEGIAVVLFDDPDRSVNVLTEPVMRRLVGLMEELRPLIAQRDVRGVIFRSGKPDQFIAGADVEAIGAIEDPSVGEDAARFGQAVFMEIEQLEAPTLCAIDGLCLGGGMELGLACRYRLASDASSTRLGLPEVQLGILPAWGGTTRLPRLLGLRAALDLLLTGKKLDGRRALRVGLIDAVLPSEGFPELARSWLMDRLRSGPAPGGARRGFFARLLEDTLPGSRLVFSGARKRVLKQTGGHYPAPLAILDTVREALGRPLGPALQIEAKAAGSLIASDVSKNLIHLFGLRERAKKGAANGLEDSASPTEVMGVVGAGVMGGGIAQLAAARGIRVRLKDIRHEAIASGLAHADSVFARAVERGRSTPAERDAAMARISGSLDYSGFGTVDIVVEAVVERLEVKRQVLAELESQVSATCILATNTSSLQVDAIAEALARPEQFAGLHFFNPVDRMPLVEIVRGRRTSPTAVAALHRLAVDMGKVPVVVADGPGFVVNRILGPYLNEAGFLLGDGFAGPAIDAAAVEFGLPMGPLRLIDEIGIDIAKHAGASLHSAFGDRLRPSPVLDAISDSGRLGRKGELGFYRYAGGEEQQFDDAVYPLLGSDTPPRQSRGDERSAEGDVTVITRRFILSMMNEASRVLEDGIASNAGDVDLAMIMGTGFPPFRGGLLRYADAVHLKYVERSLDELAASVGPRFEPSDLIRDLAAADSGFYQRFPGES